MKPADYDCWYNTPRGRWIGETELRLLVRLLALLPGEHLLDVGCGTGWFSRRLAERPSLRVTGVDPDGERLAYARAHDPASTYLEGDARSLPFADATFDHVVSVAALCFIPDWPAALAEIIRVTRRRFAIAVLNHHSLLWSNKGRDDAGGYRGAHWHTRAELAAALSTLPVAGVRFHSAIFLPSGSFAARLAEAVLPASLPWGGLLVASGKKAQAMPMSSFPSKQVLE